MFLTSTQKKTWLFDNEAQIQQRREKTNRNYVERFQGSLKPNMNPNDYFINIAEESMLFQHYQFYLRDFCRRFQPPMPKYVVGTAFHYFKRFYLNNSVMDYHPYEIVLTCIYLASKVEEFNVSIAQFVGNLKRDHEKIADMILNNELILMQQLNYHLTVHNPFRSVEGFMIDIKTRCSFIKDAEAMRNLIDEFLDHSFLTDACLMFPPSQIALAAIVNAASKYQENISRYIKEDLIGSRYQEKAPKLLEILERIRKIVKKLEIPQSNLVKSIEKKLERCRNQENNPESQIYKRKMQELLDDDEGRSAGKYARLNEEQLSREEELLGK